jgi:hypothetical protein
MRNIGRVRGGARRRGAAVAVLVVVLGVVSVAVLGSVAPSADETALAAARVERVRASYAADAGVAVALAEVLNASDLDGDGKTGTLSDNSNSGDDPQIGFARVVVTSNTGTSQRVLTSRGRCGSSVYSLELTVQ